LSIVGARYVGAMEKHADDMAGLRERLLDAALDHVPFDGWSEAAFVAAASDAGTEPGMARVMFPRGALDLAVSYHKRGDAAMMAGLDARDLSAMRFRDRVTLAVQLRLEAAEREAVRRGAALFALPQNMALGAGLIWGTADAIWRALGDTSEDINWYSKRASLSAVYSATVLYWLGDESPDHEATWAFLDRRIEDVMRFERTKADFRASPIAKVLAGPLGLLGRIKAPGPVPDDLPGRKT
jgi:ubiquinone biosynthesis protein COQ9